MNQLKTIIHFTRFLIIFVFLIYGSCDAENQQHNQFEEQFIKIHDYYMLDNGIVDANRDDFLDIYTVNHTAISSLLLGNGQGTFRDVYDQWGLHHQEEFPGLEDSLDEPEIKNESGLYIFWKERQIHIKFVSSIKSAPSASGYLTLDSPVKIKTNLNCETTTKTTLLSPQIRKSSIHFKFDSEKSKGLLVIQPDMAAVPVSFQIKSQIPLSLIQVGRHKQSPSSHHFVLRLKDRHGIAWGDWNGDHLIDLAISNGGFWGKTQHFSTYNQNEIFVNKGEAFIQVSDFIQFEKNTCRSRQTAWLDLDRNNLPDLYVSGFRSPNQLFIQNPQGQFQDRAQEKGISDTEDGFYIWFDSDLDRDLDLFVAGRENLVLYLNQNSLFQAHHISKNPSAHDHSDPSYPHFGRSCVSDFDRDGDPDLFVASPVQCVLLINDKGHFTLSDPKSFGLCENAFTANWVDFDNDGLLDLHCVPGGIYKQTNEGRFKATRMLSYSNHEELTDARCHWFDCDNDGDRDVLISVISQKSNKQWSSSLFENQTQNNHWLQVQLCGPPGNPSAVGTGVVLYEQKGQRIYSSVGAADGAHYSSGHYRVYFGLGKQARAKTLEILWPDGIHQEIKHPDADQILFISHPGNNRP